MLAWTIARMSAGVDSIDPLQRGEQLRVAFLAAARARSGTGRGRPSPPSLRAGSLRLRHRAGAPRTAPVRRRDDLAVRASRQAEDDPASYPVRPEARWRRRCSSARLDRCIDRRASRPPSAAAWRACAAWVRAERCSQLAIAMSSSSCCTTLSASRKSRRPLRSRRRPGAAIRARERRGTAIPAWHSELAQHASAHSGPPPARRPRAA